MESIPRIFTKTTINWESLCEVSLYLMIDLILMLSKPEALIWSGLGWCWSLLMNMHGSVENLLTLLLLEESLKLWFAAWRGKWGHGREKGWLQRPPQPSFFPLQSHLSTQMPFALLPSTPVIHRIFSFESRKNSLKGNLNCKP